MERVVIGVAAGAGYALRILIVLLSWVPATAALALVLYGTWLIYVPASFILAGVLVGGLTMRRGAVRK